MRARARIFDATEAPAEVRPFLGQVFFTPGSEYEIYALSVVAGVAFFLVIDDLQHPAFRPAWLFDLSEPRVPQEWRCSIFRDESSLVVGPDFVADGIDSYDAMVDADADKLAQFWRHVGRHGVVSPE